MMPSEPVVEMMRRTLASLEFIERHMTDAGPYEVTQLVNSFLGALAHPWERLRDDLNRMPLTDAALLGWPELRKDLPDDVDPTSLGNLLYLVRNAFAHGNVEFLPDPSGEIFAVRFWNKNRQHKRNWGATLTVVDLRRFLVCFVELAEDLHRTQSPHCNWLATTASPPPHVARVPIRGLFSPVLSRSEGRTGPFVGHLDRYDLQDHGKSTHFPCRTVAVSAILRH